MSEPQAKYLIRGNVPDQKKLFPVVDQNDLDYYLKTAENFIANKIYTQVQLQEDLDQKARSSASIFLYLYTTVNYS
jgi:hypothetical protein